jgi:2',3'-cyclic-nucleotide 2'-phosphodiesterase (5'-nucleotidase family)
MYLAARRRPLLSTAGALVLAAHVMAQSPNANLRSVTILHTNDLHATLLTSPEGVGGFARLATAVRQEKQKSSASLYLDGGDLVQGSPVSTLFRGLPIFEVANGLGLDAAALGNHEFDYGWSRIRDFQKQARFPLLAANVVNDAGQLLLPPGYLIKEVGGVRFGIVGAVTERTNTSVRARERGPWTIAPVVPVVEKLARELKPLVDIVFVLGHLTYEEDRAILEKVPDVSFVMSGHNHDARDMPMRFGERFAVKARSHGRELGRLNVRIDTQANRVVEWSWRTLPIRRATYAEDRSVAGAVRNWESKVSTLVDVPIGRSPTALAGDPLWFALQRTLARSLNVDIAYLNPGGIRASLPAGTIQARHIWNILPFDDELVVTTARGAQLPKEIAADHVVDPARTYRLATSDYVAEGPLAKLRLRFEPQAKTIRDAVIAALRAGFFPGSPRIR